MKIYDPARRQVAKDKSGFVLTQPTTHFTDELADYRYPDGLIMPLVYGLKGIMKVSGDKIEWATDPYDFLDAHLAEIAGAYPRSGYGAVRSSEARQEPGEP